MAKGKKKAASSSSEETSSSESEQTTSTSSAESSSVESSSESSNDKKKKSSKKKAAPKKKDSGKKKGKQVTKKRKRAKKDPNAPKRPTTAYFYFAAKRRADMKKEGKKLPVTEQTKLFGLEWGQLTDKEKEHYQKLAVEDKKRYEKEMASYTPPEKGSDESSDDEKPKKKKKKDPNAPKKNLNAYFFFANEQRPKVKAKNPDLKPKELTTMLGDKWKKLNEADKKPYEKMAADDKVRYADAVVKYNKSKK